ncbi:MAG: laccase domain-containing protein [Verrucomicrobiota bacterium]
MPFPFIETFPALTAIEGLVHGFILKDPSIDVKTDRDTALVRLEEHHCAQLSLLGIDRRHLATGQQVHHNHIEPVDPTESPVSDRYADTDGLMTGSIGQYLGIFVADCGAVSIVDPVKRACALLHSGKKGTELGITPRAIGEMSDHYGSDPSDLIMQLAPCIRPPAYEVDFAEQIRTDATAAGVPANQVHDCYTCTTSDPERYYSYRKELGQTGRLFAVLGWKDS